jgi:hypothetical protein
MYPDGTLLYGPPDPKIYVIQGGARHWIPNPQTFNADGYNWASVQTIDQATLDSIALGAPITPVDGSLLVAPPDPKVFVMRGGTRHWIPDPQTLAADGYTWASVQTIDTWSMQQIPEGDPLPSVQILTVDTGDQDVGGFGGGHMLHTTAYLIKSTGVVSGQTRIWSTNPVFGFHGGVYATCSDANGAPVGAGTPVYRWGVDADNPFFGNHDLTEQWPPAGTPPLLTPAQADTVTSLSVFQIWDADSFQTILDKWVAAGQPIGQLAQDAAQVAKLFSSSGSSG